MHGASQKSTIAFADSDADLHRWADVGVVDDGSIVKLSKGPREYAFALFWSTGELIECQNAVSVLEQLESADIGERGERGAAPDFVMPHLEHIGKRASTALTVYGRAAERV